MNSFEDSRLDYLLKTYEAHLASSLSFYMAPDEFQDLVDYFLKQGRTFDADLCLHVALRVHPDNDELLLTKVYRLKDQGDWKAALSLAQTLQDCAQRDLQLFFVEERLKRGLADEAQQRFEQAVAQAAEEEAATWKIDFAEMLLDYGYAQRAQKLLQSLKAPAPEMRRYAESFIDAYVQLGQPQLMIYSIERLIDQNASDASLWELLADTQQRALRYAEAIESCNYALALNPMSERSLLIKAFCALKLEDYAQCIQSCAEALRVMPREPALWSYLGISYEALQQYEDAEKAFRELLLIAPPDLADAIDAAERLARIQLMRGQEAAALEQVSSVYFSSDRPYAPQLFVARWYFEQQQVSQAVSLLHEALVFASVNPAVFNEVAALLGEFECYAPARHIWLIIYTSSRLLPGFDSPELRRAVELLGLS